MTDQPAPAPADTTGTLTAHSGPGGPTARPAGLAIGLRIIGVALLVPAGIAWLWTYLIPTVQTVLNSFQEPSLLAERDTGEWVGGRNYERLFEDGGVFSAYLHVLVFVLAPLLVALAVAPLLALLADGAGRVPRLITRALLVAPIVLYAPTAVLAAWLQSGRITIRWLLDQPMLSNVYLITALGFGLLVAIAATAFLSALRRRAGEGQAQRWLAALVVGAVIALAIIAYGIQLYTVPSLVNGGPDESNRVPSLDVLRSLMTFNLGVGSAASTIMLVVLAGLGLAATAVLIGARTRLELREREPRTGIDLRWLLPLILLLIVGLGATLYAAWPVFGMFGEAESSTRGTSVGEIVFNTWVPTLISTVIGVGVAAFAGFGIGALRPLGRWSELLLLPFAPWLFVSVGPLVLVAFERATDWDTYGSFLNMIPPSWLSVPALFIFTLLGRGQHYRWLQAREAGAAATDAWHVLVLPQLPMLAVVGTVTWVLSAQDLVWSYVSGGRLDSMTAPMAASMAMSSFRPEGSVGGVLLATLPIVGLLGLGLIAAQLLYLDRISVRVGKRRTPVETAQVQPPVL